MSVVIGLLLYLQRVSCIFPLSLTGSKFVIYTNYVVMIICAFDIVKVIQQWYVKINCEIKLRNIL